MNKTTSSSAALGAAALLLISVAAAGQTAGSKGFLGPWRAVAEVSYVVTGGNTATSAFSLGTSFTRKWTNDSLLFKTYVLRSNSTFTTRTARGTETDFVIIENKVGRLVAENYLLSGQYDRRLSKRLLAQAGLGWDRNRFAGVDSRVIFTTGFGYAWVERKRTQIKTDAGLTYTFRKYVGQGSASFAGVRLNVLAIQKILENSSLSTQFVLDENLKRTDDWRFDWANSVTASISKSLALKTSLRTIYTHVPARQSLSLFDLDGLPTGLFVSVPLRNLDTFLTTSIVINF